MTGEKNTKETHIHDEKRWIQASADETIYLEPRQINRLYRIHLQGAYVRCGASMCIWLFTMLAFFYGAIDSVSFKGASFVMSFIILMHVPTIPALRLIRRRKVYEYFSFLINILEILGYTSFIYFVGGFRSTYLTPIYAAMIFYVGVLAPRRYPFILAGICSLSFSIMVALEHYGVLPHQNVVFSYQFQWNIVVLILIILSVILYVVAFMSSYTAGVMHDARSRLRTQNTELTRANSRLVEEIEERKRADNSLKKSEQKLHDIFENIPDALYSHDLRGYFIETNPGMKNLLGYTYNEDLPENLNLLDISPPRYRYLVREYLDHALTKGKSQGFMRVRRKDGDELILEYRNSHLHNDKGEVIGVLGAARDITDRIQAEKEKAKLQDQLQQAKKMEALGTLAGGVAHDLNNILSGIVSYPDLLLMEIPQDSSLRKPLMTIKKSGEKAACIVQDLLTLARRGVTINEPVNINKIILEYLRSPEYEFLQTQNPLIDVETHLESNSMHVMGSATHLSKTIMNLVTNAAESMPDGGRLVIETANRYLDDPVDGFEEFVPGDYIIIRVTDSGIGMSERDRERIFDPFYTKKVMGRSGTGLGLTVVWGAVKDLGGHIHVDSEPFKGSVFTIYLPSTHTSCDSNINNSSLDDFKGNGESILVVDDCMEQREIAEKILSRLGYEVVALPSGESAIEYLKKNRADLVLLDMIMHPGIDGLDTYKQILEYHPGQKAIIASGYSETERVRKAQDLGAGSYVKKPYLLEKIGMAVKMELQGKEKDT
ncbi:MAG TPA: PAS domain S-box protein [Deltaproteobacteria bacterium]|nr:PAS domain S-box protein [Deltaproteobacteria bacterium]